MNYLIGDFIIPFLARKETPEDVQKLKEWLAADPQHRDELKRWVATWDTAAMLDVSEKIDSEKAYHRFIFRAGEERTTPKVLRSNNFFTIFLRIAAIFVISFSLGILCHVFLTKNQTEPVAFIETIVPLCSKSEIKLADGSTVSLNSGSVFRYPTNYGKSERNVYLEGEGYFKVAQQNGNHFIVHTSLGNITVLGTEFNVKIYAGENSLEAILISGELMVEKGEAIGDFNRTLLKSGQKFSIRSTEDRLVPVVAQLDQNIAEAEVSWKERFWRIESVPLKELAVQLERRYDVRIMIDDASKHLRFTGTVESETLEQLLKLMQPALSIIYRIDGKNVEINIDPDVNN
jgi:ferric-dicitrate binding protein FerR (iron transport regulator)